MAEEVNEVITRGIALTYDVNEMLKALAEYYDVSASAVIRSLIEEKYLAIEAANREGKS